MLFSFRAIQAAHIFHNLECVRVYRVNMKQIVLHLSGYLAEFGQIAPENAVPAMRRK